MVATEEKVPERKISISKIRKLHLCLGVFFAPSILFFSITGALQTFSLHEDHGDYSAPEWIQRASAVHKDQTFDLPRKRATPKPISADKLIESKSALPAPDASVPKQHKSIWLKCFVLILAAGLTISTFTGIWIAFTYKRDHRLIVSSLTLGMLIPVILLFL